MAKKLKASMFKFKRNNMMIFIAVFAVVGGITLLAIHAATPAINVEPENSAITGPAISGSDTNASGGGYVQFKTTGSSACPTGWPVGAPCATTTGPAANGVPISSLKPINCSNANDLNWNKAAWGSVPCVVSINGATIDGYDITTNLPNTYSGIGSGLKIAANNVTIRNSRVQQPSHGIPQCPPNLWLGPGTSYNSNFDAMIAQGGQCAQIGADGLWDLVGMNNGAGWGTSNSTNPYQNLTLSYVELDCGGRTTFDYVHNKATYDKPFAVENGLEWGFYNADHMNIHGCGNNVEGARTNATLTNSYIWGGAQSSECFLQLQSTDPINGGKMDDNALCDHLDGIETKGTCSVNPCTAAINGQAGENAPSSPSSTWHTLIKGNYIEATWNSCTFIQGSYTIYNVTYDGNWCSSSAQGHFRGSAQFNGGVYANIVYRNNKLVRYTPTTPFGQTTNCCTGVDLKNAAGVTECGTVWVDNNTFWSNSVACSGP